MLELLAANLLSPVVLAFVLGALAAALRSDLKLPESIYSALSLYLLLAIGLKGGVALSGYPASLLFLPIVGCLALGIGIPLICYGALRKVGKLSIPDSAAIAAHYGSVSVVTFIAATTFMAKVGESVEGFMPALVAVLEVPGILVALWLAKARSKEHSHELSEALREVLTGKSIVALVGGVIIGALSGDAGYQKIEPVFGELFYGLLVLFMLELGVVCGGRLQEIRKAGAFLLCFGVIAPLVNGTLGLLVAQLIGLSVGGAAVLAVMAASASYIAAPAAVRIAIPEANPALYITASLAITFPFNLTIGIPIMYQLAQWWMR
jgi:hypothetical protein